ncbi:MAG: ribbon-helix-helix domain-containing protein [Pseudomonadota bacterium]
MCKIFIGADSDLWTSHTRSIRMDGMVTSIRLENMFWTVLEEIALRDGMNVPQLLHQLYNESIDEGHDLGNFTSFLRVCCLRFVDLQLKGLISPKQAEGLEQIEPSDILQREAADYQVRSAKKAVTRGQH